MNIDSLKTFVRSHLFVGIIAGIGTLIIVLCIFEVGVVVGYHEGQFSSRFGQNYAQNFGGSGFMGMPDGHQPTPHGVQGNILSISGSTIVIANEQQPEEKVIVDSGTVIRNQEDTVTLSSLSEGEYAVVVGTPNDQGEIDAKLIRILPAPPTSDSSAGGNTSSSTP